MMSHSYDTDFEPTFCPSRPFCPPFYLKNPHLQTILPRFIKQPKPRYQRQLHLDSTGKAAVAYDFVISHADNSRPLAVMFHGLEGSSQSHYAKSFVNHAKALGINAAIIHYRGCGGVANTAHVDYNAGDTKEMHHVLTRLAKLYPTIWAVGISLGGNVLGKYLGEYGDDAICQAAVVVSAPVDLASSAKAMQKFVAKRVYTPYLLNSLIKKALDRFPDETERHRYRALHSLDGFDDLYTAPRHGYANAKDYYQKASALPYLKSIVRPTLIVSSDDDPFLGDVATYLDVSPCVQLLYTKHGGHVGFVAVADDKLDIGWLAATTFEFFEYNANVICLTTP